MKEVIITDVAAAYPDPTVISRVPFQLQPKPAWLRIRMAGGSKFSRIKGLIQESGLNTVCQEARCPNQGECFSQGTATFLLMGNRCTRNCTFCAVFSGPPDPLDTEEPKRVAEAIRKMGIQYAVLTSVTRDDLRDGGADHFRRTVLAIKEQDPDTLVECLIPDFQGREASYRCLADSGPGVINHNVETVPRLYAQVRPGADYQRSLSVFTYLRNRFPELLTKSGVMVGLGEKEAEVLAVLQELRNQGCTLLTIGQYLQPTSAHLPVRRYVPPAEFAAWEERAREMGFEGVASGPLVRSSYRAAGLYRQALSGRDGALGEKRLRIGTKGDELLAPTSR
jgi:lipoic acid synthetase